MKCLKMLALGPLLMLMSVLPLQAEPLPYSSDEQVTIRPSSGGEIYYEYRVNGVIKEIRVLPKIGKPYYLVPSDTQGGPYIRMDNSQLLIPSWILFRW